MKLLPAAFDLTHLEHPGIRARMVQLWDEEVAELDASGRPRSRWPFGAYLTTPGWDAFLQLMPQALIEHDMGWLAARMDHGGYWVSHTRYYRRGRLVEARVPQPNAVVGLTYGEFNTAYVRAVATVALESGIPTCMFYRAAPAGVARDACRLMEGAVLACTAVLDGHRAYDRGVVAEIAVPAGPNCHHSIRIPAWTRGEERRSEV